MVVRDEMSQSNYGPMKITGSKAIVHQMPNVWFLNRLSKVTVNLDSELLRKAQAKGIDSSITLEQELRRMVSGT